MKLICNAGPGRNYAPVDGSAGRDRSELLMTPHTAFHLILIKPSHYDDDGYVLQWVHASTPSNTLATLYGLALDCIERKVLGEDVEIRLHVFDETINRVRVDRLIRTVQADGGNGLVALCGVQTNQYPRAVDICTAFRAAGIQTCIGGFHVSGSVAMLPGARKELQLQQAMDAGISLFAGEAEGRFDEVLRDAMNREMQPVCTTTLPKHQRSKACRSPFYRPSRSNAPAAARPRLTLGGAARSCAASAP